MARLWALLVSADSTTLAAIEEALQGTGLHITTSPNAAHAAAQARDLKPALIVSDREFAVDAALPFLLVSGPIDAQQLKARAVELTKSKPAAAAAAAEAAAPAARVGRRWVLLVSSEAELIAGVEEALKGTGLHLTTAGDVGHAAAQARDLNPVLVVSDTQRPDLLSEARRLSRTQQPEDVKALALLLTSAANRGS